MDVIKRDGSKEAFDQNKIARVTQAAGLDQEKATYLANQIASELGSNQEVTSLQIRDLVSKKLKEADQYAAGLFDWYQKTKPDKSA